jgi:hypothetical protein
LALTNVFILKWLQNIHLNLFLCAVFIPANSSDQFESNYAIPRKNPIGLMQNCRQHCYTNLSPFLRIIQKPAKRSSMVISPHDENTGEPKSNSDSGMEERNTLEEEWEKQTQFVNISDGEEAKLYENLPPPPTIHQQMEAPKPPTRRPPANPPQQPYFGTMGNLPQSMPSHHQFMVEDVPALYGQFWVGKLARRHPFPPPINPCAISGALSPLFKCLTIKIKCQKL